MQFGGPAFVLAIIAMSMAAWVITTYIRARHGYPLEDEWGGKTMPHDKQADQTTKALVSPRMSSEEHGQSAGGAAEGARTHRHRSVAPTCRRNRRASCPRRRAASLILERED